MGVVFEVNRDGSFSSVSKVATKEEVKAVKDVLGSGDITVRSAKTLLML